jgi:hypothetical protein
MKRLAICALIGVVAAGVPTARGGLYDDIYRGLDLLATPSGSPLQTAGDGTRVNGSRSGRLRIVPETYGKGYTIEFDRTFGADSHGRPEVLDLGAYELQLAGSTQATLGYTRRGMLIGNGSVAVTDLAYAIRGKSGAQDVSLSGKLSGSGSLEVNQLGFYTMNLDLQNTSSTLTLDGLVANDTQNKNFDIGPISIKGNVYIDALSEVLSAFGVDTTGLQQLSAKSPMDQIGDALRQQIEQWRNAATTAVAGVQYTNDGQLPPLPGGYAATPVDSGLAAAPAVDNGLIPEPGTLLLVAAGGLFLSRRRR